MNTDSTIDLDLTTRSPRLSDDEWAQAHVEHSLGAGLQSALVSAIEGAPLHRMQMLVDGLISEALALDDNLAAETPALRTIQRLLVPAWELGRTESKRLDEGDFLSPDPPLEPVRVEFRDALLSLERALDRGDGGPVDDQHYGSLIRVAVAALWDAAELGEMPDNDVAEAA